MKKLFVSLPMKDKTEEEIINRIIECKEEAEKILKEETKIINPYITRKIPDSANDGIWCTSKYMEDMAFADVVYFDINFENDELCSVLFNAAVKNKIDIIICNDVDEIRAIYYKSKWIGYLYANPSPDINEKPKTLALSAKTINMIVKDDIKF